MHTFRSLVLLIAAVCFRTELSSAARCQTTEWKEWRNCAGDCRLAVRVRNRDVQKPPFPVMNVAEGRMKIEECPVLFQIQKCRLLDCLLETDWTKNLNFVDDFRDDNIKSLFVGDPEDVDENDEKITFGGKVDDGTFDGKVDDGTFGGKVGSTSGGKIGDGTSGGQIGSTSGEKIDDGTSTKIRLLTDQPINNITRPVDSRFWMLNLMRVSGSTPSSPGARTILTSSSPAAVVLEKFLESATTTSSSNDATSKSQVSVHPSISPEQAFLTKVSRSGTTDSSTFPFDDSSTIIITMTGEIKDLTTENPIQSSTITDQYLENERFTLPSIGDFRSLLLRSSSDRPIVVESSEFSSSTDMSSQLESSSSDQPVLFSTLESFVFPDAETTSTSSSDRPVPFSTPEALDVFHEKISGSPNPSPFLDLSSSVDPRKEGDDIFWKPTDDDQSRNNSRAHSIPILDNTLNGDDQSRAIDGGPRSFDLMNNFFDQRRQLLQAEMNEMEQQRKALILSMKQEEKTNVLLKPVICKNATVVDGITNNTNKKMQCGNEDSRCCRQEHRTTCPTKKPIQMVTRWYRLKNQTHCLSYNYAYCGPDADFKDNVASSTIKFEEDCYDFCYTLQERKDLEDSVFRYLHFENGFRAPSKSRIT